MSKAIAYTVASGLKSSGSPVRIGLVRSSPTVAVAIGLSIQKRSSAVHYIQWYLLHLPIPPLDAHHVVLHHLRAAFAEVLSERLFDARINLLVRHVRVLGV